MDSQLQKLYEKNLSLTKQDIKNSVQQDTLIMSAANSLETLQKITNTTAEKFREWAVLYNPELAHQTKNDKEFADKILSSKKNSASMGGELSAKDLEALHTFAKTVQALFQQIQELNAHIETTLKEVCPNTLAIAGPALTAKLLMFAGGLKKLSEMPSSTIQLLGAEKALFRHVKQIHAEQSTSGRRKGETKSPKFGILFMHPWVQRAKKEQGKIARALADKISIAVKVDFFKGKFIGETLKKQLEARFK